MAESRSDGMRPPGNTVRRALRWLDERRREDPGSNRVKLIDEAALRFDLTPNDVEFLLKCWGAP